LAGLVFIRKVTLTTTVTRVTEDDVEDGRVHVLQGKGHPALRCDLSHPRPVLIRRHGED